MSGSFILVSIFEVAVAAFIIYGLINEDKFAETERRFFGAIFRYLKKTLSDNSYQHQ